MVDTPGKLSLWAIEVFVATVEEGSVSLAAKRLGASVSSISQHLSNLETALGASLLDRSRRPQRVTNAGALFLRRAQTILCEANQAKAELAVNNFSQMSRLRLGIIDDFDADVTPALMSDLARDMHNCQFLLESGPSYGLAGALESRSMDVIVTADLDFTAPWMDVRPLLEDPFVLAVAKDMLDPESPVVDQLLRLPFIRYSSRQIMGRQIEAHLARQRIVLPNRFEFGSYHAIMSMVAAGNCWTITTPLGYMRAQRFRDQVEMIPLPFKALSRNISLVSRKDAMERIPGDIAKRLRPLISDMLVTPCVAEFQWLEDRLRIL